MVYTEGVRALETQLQQARLDGERAVDAARAQWRQQDQADSERILAQHQSQCVVGPPGPAPVFASP